MAGLADSAFSAAAAEKSGARAHYYPRAAMRIAILTALLACAASAMELTFLESVRSRVGPPPGT